MEIFPAIDLSGGKVVRLTRGDYNQMTVYNSDPVAVAQDFAASGAQFLHVVDLDGAKDGTTANFAAIRAVTQAAGMFVEVGGGIRDEERIKQYLDLGVGRVILGTAAVKNFPFTQNMAFKYGDKIAVGVDARYGKVAISGWLESTELDCEDFCRKLAAAGVKTVIVTDIARDGALGGANLALYHRLASIAGLNVVASGGVSYPDEITKLAKIGISGVIIGKALYAGKLDLAECLRLAKEVAQ
ncbi:MAG TPA: 1-(5-phosphoribosyl)-5-[(5-phosphoribosylamino)methylideneamino]imidazole-4-carboxamide isomerase [Candidatus Avidehalobacter gallistercoris]|uniref:1-(5-phosphoribosyl)-5-[(5-phosphoribosylamino)methylideneamino] imidazole-4-carboxamide isomerase n=1 Tax=Candidatus Avidehalobacter gallistercoris TaxID=2840694 RepID=A0A9D1HII2_9FIRM|nr:1-(5-phosphoribosyl)-5-[(5-phosphoribosylamino)methylideneamino]imidazole-4-carboxamide isomerase [Candidatus Avidehalobacter gallistercoris]